MRTRGDTSPTAPPAGRGLPGVPAGPGYIPKTSVSGAGEEGSSAGEEPEERRKKERKTQQREDKRGGGGETESNCPGGRRAPGPRLGVSHPTDPHTSAPRSVPRHGWEQHAGGREGAELIQMEAWGGVSRCGGLTLGGWVGVSVGGRLTQAGARAGALDDGVLAGVVQHRALGQGDVGRHPRDGDPARREERVGGNGGATPPRTHPPYGGDSKLLPPPSSHPMHWAAWGWGHGSPTPTATGQGWGSPRGLGVPPWT